ncbi:MAG: GNAT family N-acetyltransferase [Defluviitaleaceae bacterium]|nr:GNAT family N-acetyltransferase [Defluviitaleaceae bacterium]
MVIIGENIRYLRMKKGVTQEELAVHLGITHQSVSKWENGVTAPDLQLIPTIAEYFGVTIDTLFKASIDPDKVIITYNDIRKDLPNTQLRYLFVKLGWCPEDDFSHADRFNNPFINSTLVISAWAGERLVGCARVLSDKIVRSVIHDVAVDPEYQGKGIGKNLVKRCLQHYPKSEWLVSTETQTGFYKKLGFSESDKAGIFLHIPSKYF